MIKIKEKYLNGFKKDGVFYYLNGTSQEKLQVLYNSGQFDQFLEKVVEIETIEEGEFFEDKLIKPKKKKEDK